MKEHNEAVAPASVDEGCVSGLIGNVLSLIISILMWLQKVGCKNEAPGECPGTCDLSSALQQLTVFAAKAEDVGAISSGSKSKKLKKEDSKKSLKKSKSGDNRSVMYAVDQNDPDCKKCCKKVIEPKEKKSKDNVIFEVVSAQMVEEQTQTEVTMMADNFTQPDEIFNSEKHIETDQRCICSSTQVSSPILNEKPPTQDAFVQVDIEIEKDVKDQLCECEIRGKNYFYTFESSCKCMDAKFYNIFFSIDRYLELQALRLLKRLMLILYFTLVRYLNIVTCINTGITTNTACLDYFLKMIIYFVIVAETSMCARTAADISTSNI